MHTIYWTVFNLNFINDFQIYKMANYNFVVQIIMCYEFGKNLFWLNIVLNKQ